MSSTYLILGGNGASTDYIMWFFLSAEEILMVVMGTATVGVDTRLPTSIHRWVSMEYENVFP
jgi:hypothetical protein